MVTVKATCRYFYQVITTAIVPNAAQLYSTACCTTFYSISVSVWVPKLYITVHCVQCKVYKWTVYSVQCKPTQYTYTVSSVKCTCTQCTMYSVHSCLDKPAIEVLSQSCLVTDGQLPTRILHGILLPSLPFNMAWKFPSLPLEPAPSTSPIQILQLDYLGAKGKHHTIWYDTQNWFLAALSSSRTTVVCPLVCRSVRPSVGPSVHWCLWKSDLESIIGVSEWVSDTLYTSRKPPRHLLAKRVPSCEEPGSAHEQTCKISREELPHPIKQRRDELGEKKFFVSLPLRCRLLITVDSCAEWGWPDTLGTIQGAWVSKWVSV